MHCGDRWLLSILVCTLATATEIEVRTPYGQIQGFQSGSASVFLGIRYAKAPIGDLRLEKPVPVDPWRSPHQATSFGTSCYPEFRRNNFQNFSLSEDCLFLNVFAPQNAPPEGLPAVVFFHGGSFMRGSSTELGVDGILRNFVSRDLVFVTVNYRLSVLGFVTTEDDVLPGNLGFWDQTEALRFVKKVISSFGGNPDDITVGGSSAGATSVSALTLSPHSN
uniref:Carboxylic ester hydrolase n=1 Tax=Steinernema glaseri TaxID=37863 RepID=A0A1I8A1J5_9BILA